MEENTFADQVANKIRDLGLTAPAILFLETHKPLAFIGSQILLIAQPTLDLFFSRRMTQKSIELLSNSSQLEQLIVNLETGPVTAGQRAPIASIQEEHGP